MTQQATATHPHHAAGHQGPRVPLPIAVLDLKKLSRIFYHAAFVIVEGPNLKRNDSSALPKIWQTHVATFLTAGLYDPVVRDIDIDPAAIHREADAMAAAMIERYLDILHEKGPRAAHTYALSIYGRQRAAEAYNAAVFEGAADINAETSRFAGVVARGLNNTIAVCEIALAVGAVVIGAGVAVPAFLAGGTGVGLTSAATLGMQSFALGTVYNFASKAVTMTSMDELKAVAVDIGKDLGPNLVTTGGGMTADHFAKGAEGQLKTYDQAIRRCAKINKMLGEDFVRSPTKAALSQRLAANMATVDRAAGPAAQAAKTLSAAHVVSKACPVIQFALDLKSLRESWIHRNEQIGDD